MATRKSRPRRLKCTVCREWFVWEREAPISPSSNRPRFCPSCRAKTRVGRPVTTTPESRARNARTLALFARYGVTADEWDQVFEEQGGVCAGCGAPPPESGRAMHSDHDHKTRVFRGILCWKCNNSILRRGVTPGILRALAEYLENPPAVRVLGERRGGKR